MTKSTITREQLLEIIETDHVQCGEASYLARISLDAMDSEPVAWRCVSGTLAEQRLVTVNKPVADFWRNEGCEVMPLYRHAQLAPVSEPVFFIEVEGDDWINAGRIEGKKRPDLGLLPDGINYLYAAPQPAPELTATVERLNASGYEYEGGEVTPQNVAAVVDILLQQLDDAVQSRDAQPALERDNVRREHAEWSQATFGNVGPIGPLKHLSKEALEAAAEPGDLSEWADMQFLLWDAQRRAGITDEQITQAMIEKLAVNKQREWPEPKDGEPRLHIKEQPAPVVRDERKSFESFMAERFGDSVDHRRAKNGDQGYMAWDMVVAWIVWQARAMLQAGNSPVIPEGYVMVPKEPTEDMIVEGFESWPDEDFSEPEVWEEYQNMSGCQQAAHRARLCWAAMIAAAPKQENI